MQHLAAVDCVQKQQFGTKSGKQQAYQSAFVNKQI